MKETYLLEFELESDDHTQMDLIEHELDDVRKEVMFSLQQQARQVKSSVTRASRQPVVASKVSEVNPKVNLPPDKEIDQMANDLADQLGAKDVPTILNAAANITVESSNGPKRGPGRPRKVM